jgi:uncharacterized protein
MRLLFPSLVLFSYVLVSLIWPMPCRPLVKALAATVLLCISQKYTIYETLGHSFIAPGFPTWLLLIMEVMFSTLVILVFLLVMKDLLALGFWLSRFLGGDLHLPFTAGVRGVGLAGAAFFLALYGTWQAMRVPDVHTVEIMLPRLPTELDGFSMVQLSDIHVGLLLKGKWLQEVVNRTNSLEADLVVLTGDMIDGSPEDIKGDMAPLRDLQARHGVYGVTGNHEYYFNLRAWLPAFRELGIEILQNESRTFHIQGKNLVLSGVPDLAATHYQETGPDLQSLQDSIPEGVKVLLQHRPSGVSEGFQPDLQLSGHTHGGNLFFIKWLIAAFNGGLVGGLFDLGQMKLYVSPGTGIWAGFSCRLGIPSEITRIILRPPTASKI